MNLIPLTEREPNRQSGVDPYRSAVPNIKVTTAEITGDGSCFFFSEVARAFVGSEGGGGCASEGAVIVIVMLMREVRLHLSETQWRRKAGHRWACKVNSGQKPSKKELRPWCMMEF